MQVFRPIIDAIRITEIVLQYKWFSFFTNMLPTCEFYEMNHDNVPNIYYIIHPSKEKQTFFTFSPY